MLAPPQSFSQLATSFLAWLHLGIPRALLPRLVCPCFLPMQRQPHHASGTLSRTHAQFYFLPKALYFSQLPTPMFSISISSRKPGIRPLSRPENGPRTSGAVSVSKKNESRGVFVWCDF